MTDQPIVDASALPPEPCTDCSGYDLCAARGICIAATLRAVEANLSRPDTNVARIFPADAPSSLERAVASEADAVDAFSVARERIRIASLRVAHEFSRELAERLGAATAQGYGLAVRGPRTTYGHGGGITFSWDMRRITDPAKPLPGEKWDVYWLHTVGDATP
jgi:hypothetical protein